MNNIRTLALALIRNNNDQYLYHEAFDSVKNEKFYRPLGGGIEFGEYGSEALKREFQEEIQQEVVVGELVNTFENIFVYEGKKGHQIILLYQAKFSDENNYSKTFEINENGKIIGNAVWKSLDEIKNEGAKLYPDGLMDLI